MSRRGIDRLDLRILSVVSARARESIADIARQVGLSSTPCANRMQRLAREQYIVGYHADVDMMLLASYRLYWVTAALKVWTPRLAQKVDADITASPHIVFCDSVLGSLDYLMWVCARDVEQCRSIFQPFQAYELQVAIHPTARRIIKPQTHRFIAELAGAKDLL